MDFIDKYILEEIEKRNQKGLSDFEGYSPAQMQFILYNTFSKNSPVVINKVSDKLYSEIPLLNQIKHLLNIIKDSKELLLTKKGFLPTKIVANLYKQQFITDYAIENGITKLYKETDVNTINLTRLLIELSPFVKKRTNKLSLTKKGAEAINNNFKLFNSFFEIFTKDFNWAYYDGYDNDEIGQLGFGFTLILLNKYGNTFRPVEFYAEKYLKAFNFPDDNDDDDEYSANDSLNSYTLRSFDRSLNYFGLIDVKKTNYDVTHVKKSKLFDKLIKIQPHNNMYKV